MLSELIVHNFAIIRHLEVSFEQGLNIVTGETGAGKSILVGAVNLILGSRASQEMIRTGADEASVEAFFSLPDRHFAAGKLEEWGIDSTGDLIIRRTIARGGKSRVFINGRMAALQQLQQLARGLISVSGQHEHQMLLNADVHLGLLDTFGRLELERADVGEAHSRWAQTLDSLRKLRKLKQERASQLDWMRFQLNELETARLQPDEDVCLQQEINILKHAAILMDSATNAYQTLYAARGSVLEKLADVEKNLQSLSGIDPAQEHLRQHLEQGRIHLEELAHGLQQYSQHISSDPQRLSMVEERLALLQRLGKKYGGSVEAMLQRLAELREALALEEDADSIEDKLVKELARHRAQYLQRATALSGNRQEAALRLSREVQQTLAALDMPGARFSVEFDPAGEEGIENDTRFTPDGIDVIEFFLSANPGEDLKPLGRVASGGELSRILLALKSLLSREGEAETLIFDEVDAGIGGRTADLVGLQLLQLAARHQVICITHLPQIACYGMNHYKVAKQSAGDETLTTIEPLTAEDRLEELARMLGGISISERTRAHARELLLQANKRIEHPVRCALDREN